MGAGHQALTGPFGHRQLAGFIGRPTGNFGIELLAPCPQTRVKHPPPQWRHHGKRGHRRITDRQHQHFTRAINLQQSEPPHRMNVMISVALQVYQQQPRNPLRGLP